MNLNGSEPATLIQILGAVGFGALIGWYVYHINRHRKTDVKLEDLVTLMAVLGSGAVVAIFPARTDLFGAYGIGLFCGFFGYFFLLVLLVSRSSSFNADWFLDGRRRRMPTDFEMPGDQRPMSDSRSSNVN